MDIALEVLATEHVPVVARLACDPRISSTSGVPPDCGEDVVRGWMPGSAGTVRSEMTFAVVVQRRVAGCCVLKKIDRDDREAELSYWLGVDYWGQGIATRAASLLRDFAFEALDLEGLHAHYLESHNAASGRILAKLGFVPDATKPDLPVSGRFERLAPDAWTFVVLPRPRWRALVESPAWCIRRRAPG